MIGYSGIPIIVFVVLAGRVWIHHGPRIPLIFLGILGAAYISFPWTFEMPLLFPIFVCLLAMVLRLVETVKDNPWR
jgi:hypothetical protein